MLGGVGWGGVTFMNTRGTPTLGADRQVVNPVLRLRIVIEEAIRHAATVPAVVVRNATDDTH